MSQSSVQRFLLFVKRLHENKLSGTGGRKKKRNKIHILKKMVAMQQVHNIRSLSGAFDLNEKTDC